MTTSRMVPAYNALLAIAQTVGPSMTSIGTAAVEILDGPQAEYPTAKDFLALGVDDVQSTGPSVSLDGQQEWVNLGGINRDETFTIYSTYVAWTGDNTLSDCRARADANLGLLENALRINPAGMSLNGALTQPGWCGMGLSRIQQISDGTGVAVHVQFVVICRARI